MNINSTPFCLRTLFMAICIIVSIALMAQHDAPKANDSPPSYSGENSNPAAFSEEKRKFPEKNLSNPRSYYFNLLASDFKPEDERIEKRTPYSKTFSSERTTSVIMAPFHYENEDGYLVDRDLNVYPSASEASDFECIENEFKTFFKSDLSSDAIRLGSDGFSFSMGSSPTMKIGENSCLATSFLSPTMDKNTLVYPDIFDGVDSKYEIQPSYIKHTYLLEDHLQNGLEGDITFSEVLSFTGYDIGFKDENGNFSLSEKSTVSGNLEVTLKKDGDETICFTIPELKAWDASFNGSFEEGNPLIDAMTPLETTIEPLNGGKFLFSYVVPCDWVCEEERAFPLTVDPTVVFNNSFDIHETYYNYPFRTFRPVSQNQVIIRDEYINLDDYILTDVGVLQTEDNSYANRNIIVKIGETSQNSYSYSNQSPIGGLSEVYTDNYDFMNEAIDWVVFDIDDYAYGDDNLVVQFSFDNCDGGSYSSSSSGGFFSYDAGAGNYLHQRQHKWSCNGSTSSFFGQEVPAIQLTFEEPISECPFPDNIHVDNDPADGEVKLDWSDPDISGCTNPGYTVQYRVNSGSWQTSSTNSTYTNVSVSPGDEVEWRIRTNCCDGSSSGYTSYMTYTVPMPCPEPSGISVSVDAPAASATVSWDAMPASVVDEVRIRLYYPNGTSTLIDVNAPTNSWTFTGLTSGNYQVELKTYCNDGTDTGYSSAYLFTVPVSCSPPSANFYATPNTLEVMVGESITFTDISTGGTSRSWTFEGASPSSSSSSSVSSIFNTPGTMDVILVSTNSCGNHTASVQVKVKPDQSLPPNSGMTDASDYPNQTAGDPVNLRSGNLVKSHYLMGLSGIGGDYPLVLNYNSGMGYEGIFGKNTTYSYEYILDLTDPDKYKVRYPDGAEKHYARYVSGEAIPMHYGMTDTLYKAGSYYYLEAKNGTKVRFGSTGGYCQRITDRYGKYVYHSFSGGLPSRVNLPGGRKFYFQLTGGQVIGITDNASRSASLTYSNGNITSITNVRGKTSTFSYQNDLLTEVYDAKGSLVIRNTYQNGKVVEQEDINGDTYFFTTPVSFPGAAIVTRPDGSTAKTYYDSYARPYSNEDALGHSDSIVYNEWHKLIKYYDKKGVLVWNTDYAGGYLPTIMYNAVGDSTSIQYGAYQQMESITYPNGEISSVALDTDGNPTNISLPTTGSIGSSFDGNGQRISITDLRGYITGFLYNSLGDNYRITTPEGNINATFTQTGAVQKITDRNSRSIEFVMNEFQKLTQWKDAKLQNSFIEYDDNGNVIKYTDRKGIEFSAAFDTRDRLVAIYVNGIIRMTYTWDELNRPTSSRDAYGQLTDSLVYDPRGLVSQRFNGIGWFQFVHDENGRLMSVEDPLNQVWSLTRDVMGRALPSSLTPMGKPYLKLSFWTD